MSKVNKWYHDSVIYQIHIKSFMDSNNDGIGDFKGLISKLEYIKKLGVNTLWLLPFYPSPLRDDGFDISDYKSINPTYGTINDFKEFISKAHDLGLKVITELVINHTSDQHPWFQRARKAPKDSVERNYYVWSDDPDKYSETRIIFCDTEKSNWTWDEEAEAYYWHRFYSHQPDLNFDNPQVFREVTQIMSHWLDMGVDGMRLDAIPYLVEREGTINENLPETHDVIRKLRAWMDEHYEDRMFLAEANQWPEEVVEYFGDEGEKCNVCYHFPVMPRLYMALAKEDSQPIIDIMEQTPQIPDNCQWAMFLRNHDELTLEMVTERERQFMWDYYAPDKRARINMGIRRRLAPLVENDRRKIELLNSFLMSLPGAPIIYYGDEIGMGDNIYLNDRDGVRTPMQWSVDRNGGFSKSDPAKLFLPAIQDIVYGYQAVNVEAQEKRQSSLLNWMRRLIEIRSQHKVFVKGDLTFLPSGNRTVISYLRENKDEKILCVANLSGQPQHVELDLRKFQGYTPVDLMGVCCFPVIGEYTYQITMPEYGFFWFLIVEAKKAKALFNKKIDYSVARKTLVMPQKWQSLASSPATQKIFEKIMMKILPNKRWYSSKNYEITKIDLVNQVIVKETGEQLFAILKVHLNNGEVHDYFLPLSIDWGSETDEQFKGNINSIFSRTRCRGEVGTLYDAIYSEKFATKIVEQMGKDFVVDCGKNGKIAFSSNKLGKDLIKKLNNPIEKTISTEQSNSSVIIGDDLILKIYRKVAEGKHPEVDVCRYLTEVAGFKNTPPYLGVAESYNSKGKPTALAILQGFIRNQGDGWSNTLAYLERFFEDIGNINYDSKKSGSSGRHSLFLGTMETLGKRTAEMHKAFAKGGVEGFEPEAVTKQDIKTLISSVKEQSVVAKKAIEERLHKLPLNVKENASKLLDSWHLLDKRINELTINEDGLVKTRYHGDYHLGQLVVAQGDFYILDFEGEPLRPLNERNVKQIQLKDVAGMIRSFNYATFGILFNDKLNKKYSIEKMKPWVKDWEKNVVNSFLKGYTDEIKGCKAYPANDKDAKKILDLFIMEKALYEVIYEVANRPDWLPVPIMGLYRLIELDEE